MGFHCTIFSGNLSADPKELGESGATFSIPVNEKWTTKSGEAKEHTEWYNCVVNGGQAKAVLECLHKGSYVVVRGRQRTKKVNDLTYVNTVVERVEFGPKVEPAGAPF